MKATKVFDKKKKKNDILKRICAFDTNSKIRKTWCV